MRLTVLSDIHGNLEALGAVLDDAANFAPEALPVCLGDMVGYGANPEEVVRAVRDAGAFAVLGNHEAGVLGMHNRSHFNPQAWEAVRWTAAQLSGESMAWLATLPSSLSLGGCRFVHGLPPDDLGTYLFQASPDRLVQAMALISEDVCFVGHTHQLMVLSLASGPPDQANLEEGTRLLPSGFSHIVNAGSVGQPRDGNPKAKYCVYDSRTRELTTRFVAYDARKAARKILAAGLPRVYAERLERADG